MIISTVNKHHHKNTHKFGIRIPRNSLEVLSIDKENDNTIWTGAMDKKMGNVRVEFRIMKSGQTAPIGYQFLRCHGIWDVKIDSFKIKFRLVAGGHMAEAPALITYVSVFSRDSVLIALTIYALHDLEVKAPNIMNAYLCAPNAENN